MNNYVNIINKTTLNLQSRGKRESRLLYRNNFCDRFLTLVYFTTPSLVNALDETTLLVKSLAAFNQDKCKPYAPGQDSPFLVIEYMLTSRAHRDHSLSSPTRCRYLTNESGWSLTLHSCLVTEGRVITQHRRGRHETRLCQAKHDHLD